MVVVKIIFNYFPSNIFLSVNIPTIEVYELEEILYFYFSLVNIDICKEKKYKMTTNLFIQKNE